jgi:outer membrane biosynthesis protein TonB
MRELAASTVLGLFLLACGGSEPPPEVPDAEAVPAAEEPPPPPKEEPADAPPKEEPKPEPAPVAEPQFTDGMSVEEAIKAVPQGAERANIDQETLGKPLQDFALYEPCKPGTVRVKMKIAVWDGSVVGTDITSTPKNDKLVACIKDRLKTLSWKAKVKSLNTVEYSF